MILNMRRSFTILSISLSLLITFVHAIPLINRDTNETDIIFFDSPALSSLNLRPRKTLKVDAQAYIFNKEINFQPLDTFLRQTLKQLGASDIPEDKMTQALDRMKLFAASGIAGAEVTIGLTECSDSVALPPASGVDLGISTGVVQVGGCGRDCDSELTATATSEDGATSEARIFTSGPKGFGVISDIDDTIKISEGTDKAKFITSTLFDAPAPVPEMPDVYKSLSFSLTTGGLNSKPQFIYISASPYQLYPYLRSFLHTSFDESTHGPLFLQNVTLSEPSELLTILDSDTDQKVAYKSVQIARVHSLYPKKSFLTVGDSTQGDPEVYAKAFKTYGGDFIRCIWVRLVEGGDNSPERFATAFEGIPQDRVRLFNDTQIPSLATVDVAGGEC